MRFRKVLTLFLLLVTVSLSLIVWAFMIFAGFPRESTKTVGVTYFGCMLELLLLSVLGGSLVHRLQVENY